MATSLDKDITRESSVKIDNREINVTLTSDQEIKLKLKGMKSGELTIKIEDLYNFLLNGGVESSASMAVEPSAQESKSLKIISNEDRDKNDKDNPMINLHDLRSLNAISGFDIPTLTKLDGLLAELIKNDKERKAVLKKNLKKK